MRRIEKSKSLRILGPMSACGSAASVAFISVTDCLYLRTAASPFWTDSDLNISSSTTASFGSITAGLPAPKPPYLAALAWAGRRARDAARVATDSCKNSMRVLTTLFFSALRAVSEESFRRSNRENMMRNQCHILTIWVEDNHLTIDGTQKVTEFIPLFFSSTTNLSQLA